MAYSILANHLFISLCQKKNNESWILFAEIVFASLGLLTQLAGRTCQDHRLDHRIDAEEVISEPPPAGDVNPIRALQRAGLSVSVPLTDLL